MKQAAGFAARLSDRQRREDHLPARTATTSAWSTACSSPSADIEEDGDEIAFNATITTEDGATDRRRDDGKRERFRIYKGHFDDHRRARSRARPARLAEEAQPDRERLGLRHHLSQGARLAVRERHRLRRRARPHRRRTVPAGSTPPSPAPSAGSCSSIEARRCSTSTTSHRSSRASASTSTPSSRRLRDTARDLGAAAVPERPARRRRMAARQHPGCRAAQERLLRDRAQGRACRRLARFRRRLRAADRSARWSTRRDSRVASCSPTPPTWSGWTPGCARPPRARRRHRKAEATASARDRHHSVTRGADRRHARRNLSCVRAGSPFRTAPICFSTPT